MIHVVLPRDEPLSQAEHFGLDLLNDLARLVPVEEESPEVVRLEIVGASGRPTTLADCVARGWYIERGDGVVRIPRSALELACNIAGAAREQGSTERDRFGRIPATQSPLVEGGLEHTAVISRAAVLLRGAVVQAAGRRLIRFVAPWPDGCRWAAAITHDLDVVSGWPVFTGLRIGELARKGEVSRAWTVFKRGVGATGKDPVWDGVRSILETERQHGIRSTWFVLCGTPSLASWRKGDLTYLAEGSRARRILNEIAQHNGEIGLHGSFDTLDRGEAFREQRERLAKLTRRSIAGVRQHFLRLNPATTPEAMARAGFSYDSSQGFADRNGFRLGVADFVAVWDARAQRAIGFNEIPFCWMDRTLSKYRGIEDPGVWVEDGLALAAECRQVEGLWVGVWHPNLVPALGFPGAPEAFANLLRSLSSDSPFFGTLGEILQWRSARRSLRVRSVTGQGDVVAELPVTPYALALEDANGRACTTQWLH